MRPRISDITVDVFPDSQSFASTFSSLASRYREVRDAVVVPTAALCAGADTCALLIVVTPGRCWPVSRSSVRRPVG